MTKIEKNRKIEHVKCWINELTHNDDYNQLLLKGYNGDELDKMSGKQIDMILNYIKAAYHNGYLEAMQDDRKRKSA